MCLCTRMITIYSMRDVTHRLATRYGVYTKVSLLNGNRSTEFSPGWNKSVFQRSEDVQKSYICNIFILAIDSNCFWSSATNRSDLLCNACNMHTFVCVRYKSRCCVLPSTRSHICPAVIARWMFRFVTQQLRLCCIWMAENYMSCYTGITN